MQHSIKTLKSPFNLLFDIQSKPRNPHLICPVSTNYYLTVVETFVCLHDL